MKRKEFHFKQAVKVVQIYRNIYTYGKALKSFEQRKPLAEWKPFESDSGYILNNELCLPEPILLNTNFANCSLLTIEDENAAREESYAASKKEKVRNQCFQQAANVKLAPFKLLNNADGLQLFLEWNYFEVGTPERPRFRLCTLQKEEPVEVKLNGKTDASLTWRRDRVFKEQHFIFVYAGEFKSCFLLPAPFTPVVKTVPASTKVINLLKPLW